MRLVSLASSSSGNCTYIGTEEVHILVDAGISAKRIETGLASLGLSPRDLSAVLVTHEHADHIAGLGVLSRRYGIPIYTTHGTYGALLGSRSTGRIPDGLHVPVEPDVWFKIGDINICPFHTDHDAAAPCAFRFEAGSAAAAVATDMGRYTDYTVEHLKGLNAIILEANHDVRMLEAGPYPYYLKQRILSDKGHLSNESSGRLLAEIISDRLCKVRLGHLSEQNNYAELAYETVCCEITASSAPFNGKDIDIAVCDRLAMSDIINI